MTNTREANIAALEELANEILRLKQRVLPRRPIVIEFCGSPKAGKTSCINSLSMFLRRNGIRTAVITERGAICPIQNKFDPNFNVWAGCSELTRFVELMSNHPKDFDVVIMDRGFFDAITWFYYQTTLLKLDMESYNRFVEFFLAPKWTCRVDILYVFKANPATALQREHANLITEKFGTIMCPEVLSDFNDAIDHCISEYKARFVKKLKVINTNEKSQDTVSFEVASETLKMLSDLVKERIAYFPDSVLGSVPEVFSPDVIFDRVKSFEYADRELVENRKGVVQPVPVAVVTDPECTQIVVAKKLNSAVSRLSPERTRNLIYFGGHVREEDVYNRVGVGGSSSVVNAALSRELKEELDIDYITDDPPEFCIWNRDDSRSVRHVAIVYHVRLNRQSMRIVTDRKEFSERGAAIVDVKKLGKRVDNFEQWSKVIFDRLIKRDK